MGVSWKEGIELAEREAFRTMGKNNAGWFIYGKRLAPVGLVVLVLGVLGWAAHWLWVRATAVFSGDVHTPAGGGTLAAGTVLLALTVLAIRGRSGHIRSFGMLVLTGVGILTVWTAFALYLLGASG